MSLTSEDDERSAAIAELMSAIQAKIEALIERDERLGARPYHVSEFDIQDTHLPLPLEDVTQWTLLSGFTIHEYVAIRRLVPAWLEMVLEQHPYPAITLWLRKDWQFAVSYLKHKELRMGYEILDDATMKLDGIKTLTRLLRGATDKEES